MKNNIDVAAIYGCVGRNRSLVPTTRSNLVKCKGLLVRLENTVLRKKKGEFLCNMCRCPESDRLSKARNKDFVTEISRTQEQARFLVQFSETKLVAS